MLKQLEAIRLGCGRWVSPSESLNSAMEFLNWIHELMSRVWPSISVDPGNLMVQVAALRRAIQDGSNGEMLKLIKNVLVTLIEEGRNERTSALARSCDIHNSKNVVVSSTGIHPDAALR